MPAAARLGAAGNPGNRLGRLRVLAIEFPDYLYISLWRGFGGG